MNVRAASPDDQPQSTTPDTLDTDDSLLAFFKSVAPQFREPANPPGVIFAGSGFIVSADGLILTTAHVVNQADDVSVTLADRREFKAKVSIDAASDIALRRIDATALPAVRLGDSSKVRPGEQVLTIGSPKRFQTTVTAGIVSATSPNAQDAPSGKSPAFFQTEIATHPDSSGGPLFNRAGDVIGIDVQVYGKERFQSLTFAIPSNAAKARMQPAAPRDASQSRLGIEVQDVDPGIGRRLWPAEGGGRPRDFGGVRFSGARCAYDRAMSSSRPATIRSIMPRISPRRMRRSRPATRSGCKSCATPNQ